MSHSLRSEEEEAGMKCIQKRKLGGKGQGVQAAKDVAEALGIAAGVQSGWLGAAAAPAPLDPAQRQVSADPRVPRHRYPNLEPSASTWTHNNRKKRSTGSTVVCYVLYMHAGTQTCAPRFEHSCTNTHTHASDRPYTDVPVTMSTHSAA